MLDPTYSLLTERPAQLRREAAEDRLARLAACCRPSTWRRAASAVAARVRRSAQPCPC